MIRTMLSATGALALSVAVTSFAHTQTAPAPSTDPRLDPPRIRLEGEPVSLTLREVVTIALAENLDIEIRLIEGDIAAEGVRIERGIYDFLLEGSIGERRTESESVVPGGGGFSTIETNERATSASIQGTQLLPLTGGSISIGFDNNRRVVNDVRTEFGQPSPLVNQRAFAAIRQPLLRNSGWTGAPDRAIRVARMQEQIARRLYEQEVIDRTADVMQGYWDLVFAIENLAVQRTSLEAALELERINELRVETGASPRVDLLQARAQVAARRTNVINARSAILDAQDRLLQFLNWNNPRESWNRPINPLDEPTNFDLDVTYDDAELITQAFELRPDFQAALLNVDIASLNRRVFRNQQLPELNAVGEVALTGLDDNASDAFDDISDSRFTDYFYGLEFRYPLQNRAARGQARQAADRLSLAETELQRLELTLATQVRAATRLLRTAQEAIEAADIGVEAARETLENEQRRLEAGASTTFQVLQFQEDLATAQVNQLQARINFQKALIEVERRRGTLIEQLGRELGVDFVFEDTSRR